MRKAHVLIGLAAIATVLAGCGKKEEAPPPPATVEAPAPVPAPSTTAPAVVTVQSVSLGKAIGPDKKVTAAADTFAKSDTIYAVVDTTGSGNATLKAKWTYHKGDKTAAVDESSQTINATGPATSEFHVSKPDGWPAGDYQVEITLNDQPAGSKKFTVN
jgi:hypothetical protein